jgi:PLD-like domain
MPLATLAGRMHRRLLDGTSPSRDWGALMMTSARGRITVLSLLLGLVAAIAVPTPATSAPPPAAPVRVSAHRSVASVPVGKTAKITGGTNRGKRGDAVQLERHDSKGWHRISGTRVTTFRRYTFSVKPPVGRTAYRVVRPATRGLARGVSGTVRIVGVRPVKVSARPSARTTLAGRTVRFTGSATAGKAGDVVRLQRRDSKGWRTVSSTRLSATRSYALAAKAPAGKTAFRVVRPATTGYAQGVSSTQRVSAASCTPMARPRGLTAWATDPTKDGTSSMAVNLSRLFCSVAPGAQIRVAVYFIHPDAESERMLGTLETVRRYLGVKVETLLDSRESTKADITRLSQLGKVYLCHFSCPTDTTSGASMHDKFVTITDMNWSAGKDPVVWSSSGNWNRRQLQEYWQTGVLFYGDRTLTREYDARYESMRACATHNGNCGAWVPSVFGSRLSDAYRKVKIGRTWHDKGLSWRSGDRGSGTQVLFSPVAPRTDPVVDQFQRYSCTAQHRTVRIAIYRMSVSRGRRVIAALKGLRSRGCDVRVIYNIGGAKKIMTEAPGMLSAAGIPRTCVFNTHDKFAYFDVVDRTTKAPRRVLWTGSQNLAEGSLSANDDTFMTSTAELATGHWASDIRGVSGWYLNRWKQMAAHPTSCVWHS